MLAWLSRPAAWTERPPVRIAAAIGLMAAVIWLWRICATVAQVGFVAVFLLLGLTIPLDSGLPNANARVHAGPDAVVIDASHLPLSGHYIARINPIGPLYTNLHRSGFRVVDMDDWDSAAPRSSAGNRICRAPKSPSRLVKSMIC